MKIRTWFIITLFLFGLLLILIAGSLVVTNQQVDRLNEQKDLAQNIERAARELSYLSYDYLLNRESQQRTRWELERSNQALEDFAFIASHDLREPLRKVMAFGDRLQARYSQVMDDEGEIISSACSKLPTGCRAC